MKKILLTIAAVAAILVVATSTTFAQNNEDEAYGFNYGYRMCHNNETQICHEHGCDENECHQLHERSRICREHGCEENECYNNHHAEDENMVKQLSSNGQHCRNQQRRRGCHR